jgi:hypothetical protein
MKLKAMTRESHHICVPAVWLKKYDYEERKGRSARGPASHCVVAENSTLEMFALEMKALSSFETSVSITSRHGITSQKI